MTKENVILIDYDAPDDWEFHKVIEKVTGNKWRVYKAISNENHGSILQKLIRYTKYFLVPLKIVQKYKKYNKVLAWQQFYGLILAFYFRLFKVQNAPQIVVMTFIYKPKQSFIGRIYDKFMKYIVTSGYIKFFVVFSDNEKKQYANYFSVSESQFVFVTLGYEDTTQKIAMRPSENYYLAAGRSNRDYDFLIKAWNQRKEQLEIICDTLFFKSTSNITVLTNCHEKDYFEKLARCKAVIVPLDNIYISSGQLVIIQAMMYGKPVIVTQNETVKDYIETGKTGLIIKKTEKALAAAILSLQDEKYYKQLSIDERKHYEKKFSIIAMGTAIGELLI